MNNISASKIIKRGLVASIFGLGLILVGGTEANAQSRDDYYGRQNDGRYSRSDDDDDREDRDERYRNDRYNRDDRYNGRDRRGNQSVRFAYQRGYQAGIQRAREDARNRGRYDNGRNGQYGGNYGGGWGNYSQTRQAYQSGYQRGYQDGMNRYRNNRGYRNNGQSPLGRILNLPF